MRRFIYLLCLFLGPQLTYGQIVIDVPSRMEFAGMKLKLDEDAESNIQELVDDLVRGETYFRKRLREVDLYFPLIEKVFKEEGLPEDFKYLIIQESGFVPNAVSSSNAVGYWQFKTASAQEVGMRVDREIDERMNIISATRGAATYLKNNNLHFDNWVYTLMSYNTGYTGALDQVKDKYLGADVMEIDKKTHWYVKKFLAHKVAYEGFLGQSENNSPSRLELYYDGAGRTLSQIAREFEIAEENLEFYNQWVKTRIIPGDKSYAVILPVYREDIPRVERPSLVGNLQTRGIEPEIRQIRKSENPLIVKVNKMRAVIGTKNDTWESLSRRGGISIDRLLKYNDVRSADSVIQGQVYYLRAKRNRARVYYHTVQPGEDAWDISQKYGIKLRKLLVKNRIREDKEAFKPGRVLWMRFIRPADVPVKFEEVDEPAQPLGRDLAESFVVPEQEPVALKTDTLTTTITGDSDVESSADSASYQKQEPMMAPLTTVKTDSVGIDIASKESEFEPIPDSTHLSYHRRDTTAVVPEQVTPKAKVDEDKENYTYEFRDYTVEKGDTYFSIGRKFEVSVDSVLWWNELTADKTLNVGQQLKIREKVVKSDKKVQIIRHKVGESETLYQISRKYDVTIKEVMEWNNLPDFNIKEGQIVQIIKSKD